MEELPLFDLVEREMDQPDRPTCPICRTYGVSWNNARGVWNPYCHGNQCGASFRWCASCGRKYERVDGRRKYCSLECMSKANTILASDHTCLLCGDSYSGLKGRGYCRACRQANGRLIDQASRHNVDLDTMRRFLVEQACQVCGIEQGHRFRVRNGTGGYKEWTVHLQIDHDRRCCPGSLSCGECVRGLICQDCNSTLAAARDQPNRLRALADYLDLPSYRGSTTAGG